MAAHSAALARSTVVWHRFLPLSLSLPQQMVQDWPSNIPKSTLFGRVTDGEGTLSGRLGDKLACTK